MPRLILCKAPIHHTYDQWDVVDIIGDEVSEADMGSGVHDAVVQGLFAIIDVDAPMDDVVHLKEPLLSGAHAEPYALKERKYSLDGLPTPYYEQLVSTGRDSVPLGTVTANQRIKSGG